jgi:hypothetical protein
LSIGSITSNPWNIPYTSQASIGSAANDFFTVPAISDSTVPSGSPQTNINTNGPNLATSGTGTPSSGSGDLFQQLAAEVQAILLQNQTDAMAQPVSTSAPGPVSNSATTSAGGGSADVTLEQQLAADLQSSFNQQPITQVGSNPNPTSATATSATSPADSTGQTQPHHHHHHHPQSGESSTDADSSGGTAGSSSPFASQNSTPGIDQSLSEAFAASIVQALQAYSSQSPATATTSLTV